MGWVTHWQAVLRSWTQRAQGRAGFVVAVVRVCGLTRQLSQASNLACVALLLQGNVHAQLQQWRAIVDEKEQRLSQQVGGAVVTVSGQLCHGKAREALPSGHP